MSRSTELCPSVLLVAEFYLFTIGGDWFDTAQDIQYENDNNSHDWDLF